MYMSCPVQVRVRTHISAGKLDARRRRRPCKGPLQGIYVTLGYTRVPLFSELRAHFVRPASRTCSTGELSGAATGQEVLLARAVAVETAEEAAVDARRSFLKRASEGTRRPSLALPLVSEVIL